MKRLLEKIRQMLNKRRTRRILTRVVSIVGALVVFVTTYALVLPAITMEKQAACGIEEHQHDDSCFEEQLICGEEESETHQHTAQCYERVMVCGKPSHVHSTECYQALEESAETESGITESGMGDVTEADPAAATDSTAAETGTADAAADGIDDTGTMEASDTNAGVENGSDTADAENIDSARGGSETIEESGKTESGVEEDTGFDPVAVPDSSAEKTGTEDAAADETADTDTTNASDANADTKDETGKADAKDTDSVRDGSTGNKAADSAEKQKDDSLDSQAGAEAGKTSGAVTENSETAADAAEDKNETYAGLEGTLDLAEVLTDKTDFYYYPAQYDENGKADTESISSGSVTDWEKVKDNTEIAPADFVRVYLAYMIPAGTLNKNHYTARYRLPGALRLTEDQIEAINKADNGVTRQMEASRDDTDAGLKDFPTDAETWRGAEAIEGTRTPDQKLNEGDTEYISATIKVENIYKDGEYQGQDLILTFAPYTVSKNQTTLAADGKTLAEGEKVKGFFALDLTPAQISCDETGTSEIRFAEESDTDDTASGLFAHEEILRTLHLKDRTGDAADGAVTDPADKKENGIEGKDADTNTENQTEDTADSKAETADAKNTDGSDADAADQADASEDEKDKFLTGSVIAASGETYEIKVTYDDDAQIPDGSELRVKELLEEDDGYDDYCQQAVEKVEESSEAPADSANGNDSSAAGDDASAAGNNTSATDGAQGQNPVKKSTGYVRVFDIEIWNNDQKIEPSAEVLVEIRLKDAPENKKTNLDVVHFAEDGPEVLATDQNTQDTDDTSLEFTTDAFSVYTIVGTETIVADYITASGDTYKIIVTYGPEAEIPEGATLEVSELTNDNKDYTDYVEKATKALAEGEETPFVNSTRLFDISIMADGKKVEPKAPVEVKIEYANPENLNETSEVGAVHFKESTFKTETEVLDVDVQGEEGKVDGVTFTTDSFSIYAVVVIDKEAGTFVFEDDNYKVTVTYTKEANIPIGTKLTVSEILPDSQEYKELWEKSLEKMNEGLEWKNHDEKDPRIGISDAAFFNISLNYEGKEIEPTVPLTVKVEYKSGGLILPTDETAKVIHFGKKETEIIDDVAISVSGDLQAEESPVVNSLEYEQNGFSDVGYIITGDYIDEITVNDGALRQLVFRAAGDNAISATKTLNDDDGDGVWEMALNVTGASESKENATVTKTNVVLVVDTSGSMARDAYNTYVYDASTYNPSTEYYYLNGSTYTRIYHDNGGWYTGSGRNKQYHNNSTIYVKSGTRLSSTKDALYDLVDSLLENNKNETVTVDGKVVSLADCMEITLVSFAGNSNSDWYGYLTTQIRNATSAGSTNNSNTLKGKINGLTATGGTNWEAALKRALEEANRYKNASTTSHAGTAADPMTTIEGEKTVVLFITDGMPTFYGNDSGSGQDGSGDYNNVNTSWGQANDDAYNIVNAGFDFYGIFAFGAASTGFGNNGNSVPSDYLKSLVNYAYRHQGNYSTTGTYTYSDGTKTTDHYYAADTTSALVDALQSILDKINNNNGYGGVTYNDGVTTGVTNTSATIDGTVNENSFNYKVTSGNSTIYTVKITDGVATFTIGGNTYTSNGETVTTTINGVDHVTKVYSVTVGSGDNAKTYKMSPAKMDNNGLVTWDLAGLGILENGYTYTVTFDVWPNQYAYDMVADLNNCRTESERQAKYAEIKANVISSYGEDYWQKIEDALVFDSSTGKYSVYTNYRQTVDYFIVDENVDDDGNVTTEYQAQPTKYVDQPPAVALTSSTMDLIKDWDDSLDEDQLDEILWADYPTNTVPTKYGVTLKIWKADTLAELNSLDKEGDGWYQKREVGWNETAGEYIWSEELDVAPGTMLTLSTARDMGITINSDKIVTYNGAQYYVLESGHYYEVTEDDIERHFELNTIIYHPMLVDGKLRNVTFKEDGSVENIVPLSEVVAKNTLKGGINVQKKVFDSKGEEITEVIESDDTFKVKITMKNADGSAYENWDYRIYYGQNNPKGTWSEANQNYGRTDHIYGSAGNGGIIETNLYIGDVIRVINVPAGVTYTVQETEYDDTVYTLGSNYTFPLTTGGTEKSFTTDGNGVSYMISKGENDNFVADSDKKVVGNAASQAVVVNKVPTARIKLLKVGDSTTALDGVQFKIFYDEECTKAVTKDATGQAIPGMNSNGIITTDSEGYADLGTLAGTYYFQEVATKDGYNLLTAPVRVNVEKDGDGEKVTASSTQEGVIFNTPGWIAKGEDGIWVVKVNNSTGVELPMTGGPGTLPYTLGGIALIMASALMYGFRMRRRERRLN